MKHSNVDTLEAYSRAFRDLINSKVLSDRSSIRTVLRLNSDKDWSFICAAMDLVGDTCSAVANFLRYGIDGPTKYNDTGEKYLRLYGILSATYIQQEAVLKLHKLTNTPEVNDATKKIVTLQIREIRHKLGAHSTDYLNRANGQTECYVPVQATLNGLSCDYLNNETLEWGSVDLRKCLEEHLVLLAGLMDKIYEKTIKTLYKEHKKKLTAHLDRLHDLRIMKDGGVVLASDGCKIIVTASSKNPRGSIQ